MGTGESDTSVVFSGQLQKLSLLDLENGNISLGGDSFLSCHLHTSFYCIYNIIANSILLSYCVASVAFVGIFFICSFHETPTHLGPKYVDRPVQILIQESA